MTLGFFKKTPKAGSLPTVLMSYLSSVATSVLKYDGRLNHLPLESLPECMYSNPTHCDDSTSNAVSSELIAYLTYAKLRLSYW